MAKKIHITELVLRDAHQSLLATRLRLEDLLPIASNLDQIGFWSLEAWGGATFDSCIRYLGEDPWERVRELKKAIPNTPLQMLLRGQNLLGYRHYADDVVERFVERAANNGIDIFRIFDALNDVRNLSTAIKAAKKQDKHAQCTMSYTTSPVHDINKWLDLAKQIVDMGADSLAIKDMSGLLKPYVAYELITKIKSFTSIPIHLHCHATTGLSTATILKSVEAGVDAVDTAISSMSMTYGHSATESVVTILQGTQYDTGLDVILLEEIASYFRKVRKQYASFEGSMRGIDSRILVAQLPGGMLTNMENQLREQNAEDRLDDVIAAVPKVRKDLGYIPLVTPTSQIVGTQTIVNVLSGGDYKTITKETAALLKGEYGSTPAPVNTELQKKVLSVGEQAISCRPADNIAPEMVKLTAELKKIKKDKNLVLSENLIDDVLTYALFPQIAIDFFVNRNNPSFFEPHPKDVQGSSAEKSCNTVNNNLFQGAAYTVKVDDHAYHVEVSPSEKIQKIDPVANNLAPKKDANLPLIEIKASLSGHVVKILVKPGDRVKDSQILLVIEAMKMETEILAPQAGVVHQITVTAGDKIDIGAPLIILL